MRIMFEPDSTLSDDDMFTSIFLTPDSSGVDLSSRIFEKEVAPEGMTQEEFDTKVIETANPFGDNENIKYRLDAGEGVIGASDLFGNYNSSTSTILLKSGVSKEEIKKIESQLPGKTWFFSTKPKTWTDSEQQKAVSNIGKSQSIFWNLNSLTNPLQQIIGILYNKLRK